MLFKNLSSIDHDHGNDNDNTVEEVMMILRITMVITSNNGWSESGEW